MAVCSFSEGEACCLCCWPSGPLHSAPMPMQPQVGGGGFCRHQKLALQVTATGKSFKCAYELGASMLPHACMDQRIDARHQAFNKLNFSQLSRNSVKMCPFDRLLCCSKLPIQVLEKAVHNVVPTHQVRMRGAINDFSMPERSRRHADIPCLYYVCL